MSDEETARIVYDADFEPGEIAGIDGTGLHVGQKVLLVQPEDVTEEPREWPGVVEELRERYGRIWAGVRMGADPRESDCRLEAWVRRRFPGAEPDPGSVRIGNDTAGIQWDDGYCDVDAEWKENGLRRSETVISEAWDADLTPLIREVLETPP